MLTSKMEANPVSILEALATEIPVVATRVGSVPTTVIDNQTGFLVEPSNADDLTAKVSMVLEDFERASQMGRNGRDLVEKNWSVEAMVRGYEDLITQVYSRKAGSSDDSQDADIAAPKKTTKKSDTEDYVPV